MGGHGRGADRLRARRECSNRDDALELFEALSRAALQDEAGGGRIGARFLGEAARVMHLPAVSERLDLPVTHDLTQAYARAGAPSPPELAQRLIGQMDELMQASRLPVDPDTEIERDESTAGCRRRSQRALPARKA